MEREMETGGREMERGGERWRRGQDGARGERWREIEQEGERWREVEGDEEITKEQEREKERDGGSISSQIRGPIQICSQTYKQSKT